MRRRRRVERVSAYIMIGRTSYRASKPFGKRRAVRLSKVWRMWWSQPWGKSLSEWMGEGLSVFHVVQSPYHFISFDFVISSQPEYAISDEELQHSQHQLYAGLGVPPAYMGLQQGEEDG